MANKQEKEQSKGMCFVIMPFSDSDGYEKGHFHKIYEQLIKPAIETAGYEPHRADEDSGSTLIHANIYDHLINAPMVLCDLSTSNPNVLYELGIRHAFDKPVVLIQEEGHEKIFDINGVMATDYRKRRLYDEVLEDQAKIVKAILDTEASEKSFSFMKLVNMQPAVVSQNDHVSDEERLTILIQGLYGKVANLEDSIARRNANERMSLNTSSTRINSRRKMFSAIKYAEQLILECERGEKVEKSDLLTIVNELDERIRTFECESDSDYEVRRKAIFLKRRISDHILVMQSEE